MKHGALSAEILRWSSRLFPWVPVTGVGAQTFVGSPADGFGARFSDPALGTGLQIQKPRKNDTSDHR